MLSGVKKCEVVYEKKKQSYQREEMTRTSTWPKRVLERDSRETWRFFPFGARRGVHTHYGGWGHRSEWGWSRRGVQATRFPCLFPNGVHTQVAGVCVLAPPSREGDFGQSQGPMNARTLTGGRTLLRRWPYFHDLSATAGITAQNRYNNAFFTIIFTKTKKPNLIEINLSTHLMRFILPIFIKGEILAVTPFFHENKEAILLFSCPFYPEKNPKNPFLPRGQTIFAWARLSLGLFSINLDLTLVPFKIMF